MKRCPTCQQLFDESNDFCLNDGTPLVGGNPAFDTPTQVFQTPVSGSMPQATRPTSPILYLIIGLLAAGFVAAMVFIFAMPRQSDEARKVEPVNNQTDKTQTNVAPVQAGNAYNAPAVPLSPAPVAPSLDGNWTGNITYPSGSAFSARMTLADPGNGQVSGQILWTLLRTTNPKKMSLTGTSATELVRGTFDPATRTVVLEGYSTIDPAGMIIKDKYRLVMSPDGRTFTGYSYGGNTRGRVTLTK